MAKLVDPVFAAPGPYERAKVLLAVYAFAFQIYCDFAGYSNIARGLAKTMGFELMVNFNLPYFATNPRDLWRRWHISLSSWIRDYLFMPLGGYRGSKSRIYFNIMTAFLLSGLWHGARWPVVLWGIYHGLALVIYLILLPVLSRIGEPKSVFAARIWLTVRIVAFFHFFCYGLLIFRAQSVEQISLMTQSLFMNFQGMLMGDVVRFVFYGWLIALIEMIQFSKNDQLIILRWAWPVRALVYFLIYILLIDFGVKGAEQFYYFQF